MTATVTRATIATRATTSHAEAAAPPFRQGESSGPESDPQRPALTQGGASPRDAALVALCRAGSPDAWEAVYHAYWQQLYIYALGLMGDPDDAYDLTMDALLKASRAWHGLRPESAIGAWLYKIVQNRCLDVLRRRQHHRWTAWDDEQHEHLLTAARPPEQPAAAIERAEDAATVRRVLAGMSQHNRAALLLREADGLSCTEIGAVMGRSRSAIKSRLFRAREEFRRVYFSVSGEPTQPMVEHGALGNAAD